MKGDPLTKSVRLEKIQALLARYPNGLKARQLAEECGVTPRTIQRDLGVLGGQLGVPVTTKGRLWVLKDYRLRLDLDLHEATVFLMAARLYARNCDENNHHAGSALLKLANCLPDPMGEQVKRTASRLDAALENDTFVSALQALTMGWYKGRKVLVSYRSLQKEEAHDHVFSPYFIEVSGTSRSTYVIGRIDAYDEVRTLKVERIIRAELLDEPFTLPAEPDFTGLLEPAWGVMWGDGNLTEVTLRFAPEATRFVKEAVWHSSQEICDEVDGGCTLTVKVGDTREMEGWILGWGSKVEVLSPPDLRDKIAGEITKAAQTYAGS